MERSNVEKNFPAGYVLYEFGNNGILTNMFRLGYLILGIWSLYNAFHTPTMEQKIIGYLTLAFSLWRIYMRGQSLIFLAEGGIIFRRSPNTMHERVRTLFNEDSLYTYMPYNKVVGFSEKWDAVYIGEYGIGGVYAIPVSFQYINLKHKKFIAKYVDEHNGNESFKNDLNP